jgi:hypothetical protein
MTSTFDQPARTHSCDVAGWVAPLGPKDWSMKPGTARVDRAAGVQLDEAESPSFVLQPTVGTSRL